MLSPVVILINTTPGSEIILPLVAVGHVDQLDNCMWFRRDQWPARRWTNISLLLLFHPDFGT